MSLLSPLRFLVGAIGGGIAAEAALTVEIVFKFCGRSQVRSPASRVTLPLPPPPPLFPPFAAPSRRLLPPPPPPLGLSLVSCLASVSVGLFRPTNEAPKGALDGSCESGHLAPSLHGLDEGTPEGAPPPSLPRSAAHVWTVTPLQPLQPLGSASGASVFRGCIGSARWPRPSRSVAFAALVSEN